MENAYELARTKGEGKTDVHKFHTHLNYTFSRDDLNIRLNDGLSEMGGGLIRIYCNQALVLYGDRYSVGKEENKFNPVIDGFCIVTYKSGDWEKKINKYLNQKEIEKQTKPIKPKEQEISKETLENLSANFDIKF